MKLTLKKFQQDALDALGHFLSLAREQPASEAFQQSLAEYPSAFPRPYMPISDKLADAPSVCLRLPTGGGKTIMAAHALKTAAEAFLGVEHPLVLWLVPSNTIRQQTIKALNQPGHPYNEVLCDQFSECFRVLDVKDFEQLRPQDLGARTIIIVSTLATARVDDTEIRKVYAHHEEMEPFFAAIHANAPGLERDEKGNIKFSMMNLFTRCRPLVIVDEAHNNKSDLSTEVMARINPSCVIEFTATPAATSNILYHVSAAQLRGANMIKLPIELTQHTTWQEAVHSSVQERQKLAELAVKEADYIRPIVLFQTENKDKTVTWETVLNYLLNDEGIARERIAVVTGTERELDDVDLFRPDCPIAFVITVQALREGWDCSFAYIFCSVATVHSKTAVEQLLGRVLRMPYARRRQDEALNRAYAHVSAVSWPNAVALLADRLTDMGFDEIEAETAIREQRPPPRGELPFFYEPDADTAGLPLFEIAVKEAPDLSWLTPAEEPHVAVHEIGDGGLTTLAIDDRIADTTLEKLGRSLLPAERKAIARTLEIRRRQKQREHAPVRQGKSFNVPVLCRLVQGEFALVEHETLIGDEWWTQSPLIPVLTEVEFAADSEARRYELDVDEKRVTQRYLGAQMTLDLRYMEAAWTEDELVRWLDAHVRQFYVPQRVLLPFIRGVVRYLRGDRGLTLANLQLYCFGLKKALEKKLAALYDKASRKGFQQMFTLPIAELTTTFDGGYCFPPDGYQPHWYYQGSRRFNKHYYPEIGELKPSGEEYDCAVALDECEAVEYWVRNLERRGDGCFRLPLSGGNFYPDFVARLKDGRVLVIEYKGAHIEPGEQEKRDVGRLWQERSNGTAVFLWAMKQDSAGRTLAQQIKAVLV